MCHKSCVTISLKVEDSQATAQWQCRQEIIDSDSERQPLCKKTKGPWSATSTSAADQHTYGLNAIYILHQQAKRWLIQAAGSSQGGAAE